MHLFQFLLVLLLIHVAHSKLVLEKLKNVRKRMELFGYHLWGHNEKQKIADWHALTEEQMNHIKWKTATVVGSYFVQQQCINYEFHSDMYLSILDLLAPGMTADVCDVGRSMNQYQFASHLNKNRKIYRYTHRDDRDVKYTLLPTNDNTTMSFIVAFQQQTTFDVTAQIAYRVNMSLITHQAEEIQNSKFLITHVHIYGDCLEYGNIDYEQTHHLTRTDKDLWKEDDEVQALMRKFIPDPLQNSYEEKDLLPWRWLYDSLDPSWVTINTCQHGSQHSTEMFQRWWGKFRMMWHPKPGDTDYIKLQMIKYVESEELVARLTFRVQSGRFKKEPTWDWDMKIRALYNKKGDYKWYIERIEIKCPVGLNVQQETYKATLEVMGDELNTLVSKGDPWFSAFTQYFQGFLNSTRYPFYVESCGERYENLKNSFLLERRFAEKHGHNFTTIYGYKPVELNYDPGEVSTLELRVFIKDKKVPEEQFRAMTTWKFWIRWDMRDQFYYIVKVVLDCALDRFSMCDRLTDCIRIGK